MKRLSIFILSTCLFANACTNASQVNAHSLKTAIKSVAFIKERLPENQRVEFEIAYWTIRNHIKDDAEFLKSIDQQNAAGIIELGKAIFAKNKAAGMTELANFDNWEQMLSNQLAQRGEQASDALDPKDKKGYPRVDYKLHSM
ncbi:hypothetical protein [Methylomonas rhizoryzae]|uniref:hypothetical protein n=1 Tax=Methylomonas rhizoryzae TaxID=2608981 RepID=UPI0012325462|nr:hypothetical protein [Methylomonas rhizoryzae]